uniref:Uncharacterized protein n=1 Tax=Glossina pallidipes TaxID=7398 RepID=A0A1A9ZQ35_GLOPL
MNINGIGGYRRQNKTVTDAITAISLAKTQHSNNHSSNELRSCQLLRAQHNNITNFTQTTSTAQGLSTNPEPIAANVDTTRNSGANGPATQRRKAKGTLELRGPPANDPTLRYQKAENSRVSVGNNKSSYRQRHRHMQQRQRRTSFYSPSNMLLLNKTTNTDANCIDYITQGREHCTYIPPTLKDETDMSGRSGSLNIWFGMKSGNWLAISNIRQRVASSSTRSGAADSCGPSITLTHARSLGPHPTGSKTATCSLGGGHIERWSLIMVALIELRWRHVLLVWIARCCVVSSVLPLFFRNAVFKLHLHYCLQQEGQDFIRAFEDALSQNFEWENLSI